MTGSLVAEAGRLLLELAVVVAPLPLILSLLVVERGSTPPPRGLADRALAILCLWLVIEALVVTSLGLVGRLFVRELLAVEAAVLLLGIGLLRRRTEQVRRLLSELGRAFGGLASMRLADRWILSLVAGVGALLLMQELRLPTDDYDSLAYQLPRVVEWYQHGTFAIEPKQWEGWVNRYPFGWSTLLLLMVAPVGHEQFALWPNLVAWVMLGLAVHGLARSGGGRRPTMALGAGALVLLMPLSVMNVHSAHNDLPLGALFTAGVYWTVRARDRADGSAALLAIATAGMLLGVKTSGLGYVALLVALWIWLSATTPRAGFAGAAWRAARRQPAVAALAIASVAVLGASWYVRNAIATGNPLGFFEISVFGRVLFPGPVTRAFVDRTNLLGNFRVGDWAHWTLVAEAIRDYPGWPGIVLLAGALAVPGALVHRDRTVRIRWVIAILCAASLYLYAAGPWSAKASEHEPMTSWMGQQMRFSFPFWALLGSAVGASVGTPVVAVIAATGAAVAALTNSALYAQLSHWRAAIILLVGIALAFAALSPAVRRALRSIAATLQLPSCRWTIAARAGIAALAVIVAAAVTSETRFRRQEVQAARADGLGRVLEREMHDGGRLGFWGTHRIQLLFGRDLARRLRYLPLDEQPSPAAMEALVRTERVDLIAVGPMFGRDATAPIWAWLEASSAFERVHGADVRTDVLVYRVRADPSPVR